MLLMGSVISFSGLSSMEIRGKAAALKDQLFGYGGWLVNSPPPSRVWLLTLCLQSRLHRLRQ